MSKLQILNSLSGKKEGFKPVNPPYVGMYVCGPTVYSDVHLGNVRTFISFDIVYRYLSYLGYKVRYVRNITDVGHLEGDVDEGEDKISKKAKLENLEPMEIVQRYTMGFHHVMSLFNVLPPNIEPSATGHIMEQIEMIQKLIENGFAYEVNGSVYFDIDQYNKGYEYGILSKRKIEDLIAGSRELDGQDEKKNPLDFAVWKNATPEHLMQWDSPWGRGFPGWHLECSVMGTKYLGETFDIHGGGMDLKFPHHECEIAQSVGAFGNPPVNYWLHTNMLTVDGQKMSKSLGNSILPQELVSGDHPKLEQAYSPMTIRFFMLQSHYSSTLDISNEALKAAQKGYKRLINGYRISLDLKYEEDGDKLDQEIIQQIEEMITGCQDAMNDDFNTALAIGHLFNLLKKINSLHTGQIRYTQVGKKTFEKMQRTFQDYIVKVLGLKEELPDDPKKLIEAVVELYNEAKKMRDYAKVDLIRAYLKKSGIILKDLKDGVEWAYEE